MSASSRPLAAPELPERYEVKRHIASGGMASVWCADDRLLGRAVAIKVLAERFAHDPAAVRRFQREARTAARVCGHPHVVTIFDVGETAPMTDGDAAEGDRQAFIVMEHLAGGTVADAIHVEAVRRHEAMRWLGEAASALDHAHGRGIVHRDIKPANFLLDNQRVLHVADFGIARLLSEETITSAGELFGTAAYLAPEQALGGEATPASDRYSLSVTAFELLAGQRPFSATNFAAQARQHVEDEPPRASERDRQLPPEVDRVLIRGMAKRPEERFETAGAFVAALERALDPMTTAAPRPLGVRRVGGPAATAHLRHAGPPRSPSSRRASGRTGGAPQPAGARHDSTTRAPAGLQAYAGRTSGPPASPRSRRDEPQRPRRGRRRLAALAALAVVALVVIGVAAGKLASTGSSRPRHRPARLTFAPRRHARSSGRSHHVSRVTATKTVTSSSTSTSAAAWAPLPAAALEAQGHQELIDGAYGQAIPTLRQALSAASADPANAVYAYALYDLAHALLLAGDPSAAIPLLQQRLKIPIETGIVQQTLAEAERASGQSSGQAGGQKATDGPPGAGPGHGGGPAKRAHHGHTSGNSSGGAGMAPEFAVSGLGTGA